jgi:hypothetical protein
MKAEHLVVRSLPSLIPQDSPAIAETQNKAGLIDILVVGKRDQRVVFPSFISLLNSRLD